MDELVKTIYVRVDGDQYYAHLEDFENLQESFCGWGETELEAIQDLYERLDE